MEIQPTAGFSPCGGRPAVEELFFVFFPQLSRWLADSQVKQFHKNEVKHVLRC